MLLNTRIKARTHPVKIANILLLDILFWMAIFPKQIFSYQLLIRLVTSLSVTKTDFDMRI